MSITTVVVGQLGYAILIITATIVLYGLRSPWRSTPMGRHLMAFMVATDAELASLFALGVGAPPPAWVFAVGFGLLDVVVTQRLLLLLRAQHVKEER